mmetsp:Transcript_18204/g.43362  ORF Transcript_18204/g.43362 Transcript_18204/m.43362 type:complete len:218 (-) Transcript_18204:510-1163(-)
MDHDGSHSLLACVGNRLVAATSAPLPCTLAPLPIQVRPSGLAVLTSWARSVQSLGELLDNLSEGLSLRLCNAELQLGRLARSVWACETACPVRRCTMRFRVIEHSRIPVPERHEVHAVMCELGNEGEPNCLLPPSLRARRHENASRLADKLAGHPQLPSRVPEGLHLRRQNAKATRDAEHDTVIFGQLRHLCDRVVGLWWGLHLGKHFRWKRLRHLQ